MQINTKNQAHHLLLEKWWHLVSPFSFSIPQ